MSGQRRRRDCAHGCSAGRSPRSTAARRSGPSPRGSATSTRTRSRRRSTSTASSALVDDMLHYFDRASMAHSLEVRVPFLDHHVVEFCATIPSRLKVRRLNDEARAQARRARARPRPDHRQAEDRLLHAARWTRWFRAQTDGAIPDYLLAPEPRYAELPRPRRASRSSFDDHAGGTDRTRGRLLLAILMLEVWLSSFVPRALRRGGARARSRPRGERGAVLRASSRRSATTPTTCGAWRSASPRRPSPPSAWVVVDTGSTDDTPRCRGRARRAPRLGSDDRRSAARAAPTRGATDRPRAFHAGLGDAREPAGRGRQARRRRLDGAGLLRAPARRFAAEPTLGIASGSALRARRTASGSSATSPARASGGRRARTVAECLEDVLPLERTHGLGRPRRAQGERARLATTRSSELPFRHHRGEGERDGPLRRGPPAGARRTTWAIERGTWCCVPSSTRGGSRPRWR